MPIVKEAVEKAVETFAANRKKRILVAEDESTARMFLLNQLKKAGFDIETASNGGIALRKLKDGNFDALIVDIMLSDVKVPDLVKQIRKTEAWANVLIFACVNAQRPDPWRGRAARNGLTKVFDKSTTTVEAVVAEIASYLVPKPKDAAAQEPSAEKKEPAKSAPEISPAIPEAVITPVQRTPAQPAQQNPAFTPLPTGRDTSTTKRPPATSASAQTPPPPAPARSGDTTFKGRDGKTGFFHNPAPARANTPNTALLRKAAQAGQASAAPTITGDTPLHIPPVSEPPPAPPKPASPTAAETASEPPSAPRERGLAEKIIAPFKIFSRSESASDTKKVHELEEQLAEVTRNRDELLALLRDHPIFGAAPASAAPVNAEGLQEAKAAAARAEAAYQAEVARSRQFEEELKRIRQARDELNRKLAEEEKAAAESRKRSKELEERLTQSSSELDQVKSELQKHIAEHSKLEGELRQQLNSSRQSADIAKVAYQEQAALAQRSTEELAALRKAREELNARVTGEAQAAAESKRRSEEREQRLREKQAEVERLKTELDRHAADKELPEKLKAAQEAAQKAEAACKEEATRRTQFEQELARLNQAREELNGKLAREEQAAAEARRRSEEMERQLAARTDELERVKSEVDRHAQERAALERELQQQVAAARTAAEEAHRALQQETTMFHRSKEEVDALRQARDQLNTQLEREQHAAAESRRHSEELEGKLQASAQELTHLRAELEKHVNERAALVNTSSRQLNAAKAAAAKAEKAYQEQLKRTEKFEKELAALRQHRSQLDGKLKTEQKSTAKSKRKINELEKQATAHAAQLEKARKDLEKQLSERERLESEHAAQSRDREGAQPPGAQESPQAAEAEARFRESISALARATAQLEKERGERRRVEQRVTFLSGQLENLHEELRKHLEVEKGSQERLGEFEQQLRDRDDALAKAISDLQKEVAARQLVEAQLKAKGEMDSQMAEQFNLLDEAKRVFNATQRKLEARLEDAQASLKQAQAKLQKQTAERKKIESALEDAQRKLHEQAQQNATELSRLQSSLQLEAIERRKLESQSLQSRYASLDASRLGRAFVNSFRTHLRPSAEHLLQASRRLLELPLEDEHKKIVEALLEDALMLQTSMQNDAHLPGESDEPAKAA